MSICVYTILTLIRGVAQFGRVLGLGPRCRRFKSCRPDQNPCGRCVASVVRIFLFGMVGLACKSVGLRSKTIRPRPPPSRGAICTQAFLLNILKFIKNG